MQCDNKNRTTKVIKKFYLRLMETRKKSLKSYYEDLGNPQKTLRERIASECGVSIATVFRWINGDVIPDKLKRSKIAEITGLAEEEIFPEACKSV